ncbi:MAG: hypothetical protein ACOH17_00730 [Cellulomonas sp.]
MRAYRFRQAVAALVMLETDLPTYRKPEPGKRLSEMVKAAIPASDIQGIPGVLLNCRTEKTRDLSTAVDEARAEAAREGLPFYAVCWSRPARDLGEAFIVTDLECFSALLAEREKARA